jgi:predicted DNA-binding transcriptional regulator YafY
MSSHIQHERLNKIHLFLRSHSKTTRQSLAEKLEISPRTVQRDINFLRDRYGAPIEFSPESGYYYNEPEWEFPAFRLSERDLFALLIARRAVALYRGLPVAKNLSRIFDKIAGSLSNKIEIHADYLSEKHLSFAPEPLLEVNEKVWSGLLGAIRNQRSIQMRYASRNSGEISEKQVDPYHILNMQGDWYFYGWDHARNRISQFLLHRIKSIKILKSQFNVHADFDIKNITENSFGSFGSSEKMKTIRLRITGNMGELMADRQFHPQQSVKSVKGGFEIKFPVSAAGKRPFYNVMQWILSMGRDVEILAPLQLKQLVRDEIFAMKKNMEN